jgi:predicted CDP-diglyceride synthetase/phosphatidate cytidylyltransferase
MYFKILRITTSDNSDVLSFILELPATFFGFNFFKELDYFISLIYFISLPTFSGLSTTKSLNERSAISFAGCKSTYPFLNHQIYLQKK